MMFARRLSVQLKPNKFNEFTKTFEKDIIPLLRKQQGFKDEITFAAPDRIKLLAISLWDTEKNAQSYDGSTYKNVLKLLGSVIAETPKVVTSEVIDSTFHQIHAGVQVA
jgi:hypothetical protein